LKPEECAEIRHMFLEIPILFAADYSGYLDWKLHLNSWGAVVVEKLVIIPQVK
jgi:hypothetical protein